ncbi:CDK-activating kinase assembly factor MAT1 [Cryptotermes secundus]|uniref:CDK-activating kinase assembly factor MAT1 n=2 Tax=Cryptotermes secundus TaxID=105785 RepID=A0A2J7Q642_9NEOP|nr:CDK-activating kinase assembly factor MAT1 [Cryptotermes secundus]PNF24060.1 CDK-activating kinase assembly factor MAT1 [Cryptotermes secundus]
MDEQACPRCKTTKYRNPSLKLMVNICGHALCESCVDLLFLKGSGSCPECNVPLRRSNFRVQLFEDSMVEKEVDIRKRVLRDFNKKEEDFSTLREYNDYLEEVETIVYNLTNNVDVIATNKTIEQYKKENKDLILKNKSKIGREEMELEELLEEEKQQDEIRKRELVRFEQEEKKKKVRVKEALIDELMFSNADAKNILETFANSVQTTKEEVKVVPAIRATQFSTGIKFGRQRQQNFLPVPKIEEGPLYVYEAPRQPTDGPLPPTWEDLEVKGYINHMESEKDEHRAGGYRSNISCLRALQEALAGLYHVSDRTELVS